MEPPARWDRRSAPRGGSGPARGGPALGPRGATATRRPRVWLFDLDNTLHDASHAAFEQLHEAMTDYMVEHLALERDAAWQLRQHYWKRYGATLLGLVRHHGVKTAHFLAETHRLPGLEQRLRTSSHDRAALKKLRGKKLILTNAPRAYALRVLNTLRLADCFDGVISIEDMTMFGHHRPKPDARMFRHLAARLKVPPSRCVLVEDTLDHQKGARRVGMKTAWMQRYLGGRFRGRPGAVPNAGFKPRKVGVHPCRRPPYVCAKIKSIQQLRGL